MRGILLDIEGTTSSISFVYDVMFPYARRELASYLSDHWESENLSRACDLIAEDAGYESFSHWSDGLATAKQQQTLVIKEVTRLMDADIKATGLKQLQGLIWRAGFEGGEMQAHVYDDVPPALQRWRDQGLDIRLYSSGSIAAQKLFFAHTLVGDLLHYFNGHYDTTTGSKKEAASYAKITHDFGLPASEILFVSDVLDELDAARQAGLRALLSVRPGNPSLSRSHDYEVVQSFDTILGTS